ncbi:uncharacterized protein LOC114934824 [Nylanderia fulva]|uniref:uncharacterized protein LOC114934824 n=1 Tax=Nylanderia fulva TaxID=613905 RepID=UPI0010FB3728|nr:uncharacterized protein LOC114934824 [Nylanderia fulva]
MSEKIFAFLCSVLLLVISSSKSQQNSINEDDNLTIRYEINTDSTTNYNDEIITLRHDLHKKFINNTQNDKEFHTNGNREDDDLIQHKRSEHLMQNKDDKQKSMKSNTNSTNINHKRNFTAQEGYENVIKKNDSKSLEVFKNSSKNANETIIVPNEMCHNDTCIRLCCFLGYRLVDDNCIPEGIEYIFPKVYTNDSTQSKKKVNELFQLSIYDLCKKKDYNLLFKDFQYEYDYKIFTNGSIYLIDSEIMISNNGFIYLTDSKMFVDSILYCFDVVEGSKFQVIFCSETTDKIKEVTDKKPLIFDTQIIRVSAYIVSILLLGSVFLVYSILPELRNRHGFMLCNHSGASFFAYGIDIVYSFNKSDDVQYPVCVTIGRRIQFVTKKRQTTRKKKVDILYDLCVGMSVYVCYFMCQHGYSFCVCTIDFATGISFTRLLLVQRFNLYLKLFIVLFILIGIKWFMLTAEVLSENVSIFNSYVFDLLNIMQNLCTFIIFVWRKKIKRMLFKRFGCGLLSKARSESNATLSSIIST